MANVKFNFVINKQANHYFFVSNLSEWHFSNRKKYNELWLEKLGALSEKEKGGLSRFKKIRKKYNESKSVFEKSFFLTNAPYEQLQQELPKKEVQEINEVMDLFNDKFEIIYKEDLPLLEKWGGILTKEANDITQTQKIIKKLETFYKFELESDKTVTCHLLINPQEMFLGGGANIDDSSITCEISHFSLEYTGYVISHHWHEATHLIFEEKFFIPFLREYFNKDMEKVSMFKELINSSFFPRGILGKEIFNQKLNDEIYYRYVVKKEQSTKIFELSQEYLDNKKAVDTKYLDKLSMYLQIKNG